MHDAGALLSILPAQSVIVLSIVLPQLSSKASLNASSLQLLSLSLSQHNTTPHHSCHRVNVGQLKVHLLASPHPSVAISFIPFPSLPSLQLLSSAALDTCPCQTCLPDSVVHVSDNPRASLSA